MGRSRGFGVTFPRHSSFILSEERVRYCLLLVALLWVTAVFSLVFWSHLLIIQKTADRRLNKVQVHLSEYELLLQIDIEHQMKVNTEADGCVFWGPYQGFIPGCWDECRVELDFEVAKMRCAESSDCAGFVEIYSDMQAGYQYRHGPNFVLNEEGAEQSWVKVCDGSGKPNYGETQDLAAFRKQQWKRPWTPLLDEPTKQKNTNDGIDTKLFPQEQDWMAHGEHCGYAAPEAGYLDGCVLNNANRSCFAVVMFWEAQEECNRLIDCKGITMDVKQRFRAFTLRTSSVIHHSLGEEYSWLKQCTTKSWALGGPQLGYPLLLAKELALNQVGTFVNGRPTVYVSVASYRDPWCKNSVTTAFSKALYPDRIFVGIAQQNIDGDEPCVDPDICEKDVEHVLCKYRDQIRVNRIDARMASGPIFGRHHSDRLYRGEYFALGIDAHMIFVPNWDVKAIAMWRSIGNEMALLTTYPEDLSKAEKKGLENVTSWCLICAATFQPDGSIRNNRGMLVIPPFTHRNRPILQTFLGAGIVFSRGHRILRVPNDCCMPRIFNGEEFNVASRSWTAGYDIYAPSRHLAFHPYNREVAPPLFYENPYEPSEFEQAINRMRRIAELYSGNNYLRKNLEKYGLGNVRSILRFYEIFGIFPNEQQIVNNCKETMSGRLHDRLHVFLRKDGLGIDYEMVPRYPRRQFEEMSKSDVKDEKKSKKSKKNIAAIWE